MAPGTALDPVDAILLVRSKSLITVSLSNVACPDGIFTRVDVNPAFVVVFIIGAPFVWSALDVRVLPITPNGAAEVPADLFTPSTPKNPFF